MKFHYSTNRIIAQLITMVIMEVSKSKAKTQPQRCQLRPLSQTMIYDSSRLHPCDISVTSSKDSAFLYPIRRERHHVGGHH